MLDLITRLTQQIFDISICLITLVDEPRQRFKSKTNIGISSDSKVIVKSMIDMAHALSYHVVAEGVEDNDTLKCLEELQCDSVQGFYFSRPF